MRVSAGNSSTDMAAFLWLHEAVVRRDALTTPGTQGAVIPTAPVIPRVTSFDNPSDDEEMQFPDTDDERCFEELQSQGRPATLLPLTEPPNMCVTYTLASTPLGCKK